MGFGGCGCRCRSCVQQNPGGGSGLLTRRNSALCVLACVALCVLACAVACVVHGARDAWFVPPSTRVARCTCVRTCSARLFHVCTFLSCVLFICLPLCCPSPVEGRSHDVSQVVFSAPLRMISSFRRVVSLTAPPPPVVALSMDASRPWFQAHHPPPGPAATLLGFPGAGGPCRVSLASRIWLFYH